MIEAREPKTMYEKSANKLITRPRPRTCKHLHIIRRTYADKDYLFYGSWIPLARVCLEFCKDCGMMNFKGDMLDEVNVEEMTFGTYM